MGDSPAIAQDFEFQYGTVIASKLSPPPEFYRKTIQEAVRREYTIEKVGIEFTGWENCRSDQFTDIQILYSSYPDVSLLLRA